MRALRRWRLHSIGALALSALAACSGAANTNGNSSAAGGHAAASGSSTGGAGGAGGEGGGIEVGCDPACPAGQICSIAKTCIDFGTCLGDGDCLEGTICEPTSGTCVPGGECGAEETQVAAIPPNLLVVLDRSCSMTQKVAGTPKWTIAVDAINKMTTDYASKIRFGLTLFPDLVAPNCGQAAIPIPVGPGNEAAIQTLLTASLATQDPYYPDGPCVTNIDTGMQQAAAAPELVDPDRASYVLLLTDGIQSSNCAGAGGDTGTTQIITDLFQTKNVATFVLGFGGQVDPAQMNIFADAGGVPSGDPMTHFYKAEDQASLDAALAAIATKTLSCTFVLASVPPEPDDLFVFFGTDPAPVPKDPTHTTGWDYDPATNTVTFYGATCDMLKSGAITDVHVVFGCPGGPG